jgi:hypothetical protein
MITPAFNLTATERVLPKLALDFTTASLDSRVTVTRTTGASNPATYVASDGYIASASNNGPRFDYDPVSKICRGLLIEESRQNLLTYSEELNRLTKTRSNILADQFTSPNNTLTADNFYDDTTVSNTHFASTASISFTSGTYYTLSVFVKKNGRNISLAFSSTSFGANVRYTFNLDAGTASVNVAGTNSSSAIVDAGNGYWRCSITAQATATASSAAALYLIDGSTLSYTGDGTSGVYIWGAQLEAGAFATSYIPTTTTSLTRNADVVSMTGTNFSDWYNATEGTFYVQGIPTTTASSGALSIDDGTSNERMQVRALSGGGQAAVIDGGSTQANLATGTWAVNARGQCVFAYKASSFACAAGGAAAATSPTGTVPTVNNLKIGGSAGLNQAYFNGAISKVNYWPQRLTNAEVQAFSKG